MSKQVAALTIAEYIISEFHESGYAITNLKLQKLLYYIQGWHLGLYGTSVFEEELEAWVHGPVEYGVYQEYKEFSGGFPITRIPTKPQLEINLEKHIHEVLQEYAGENALNLEIRTHQEWPWIEAREALQPNEPSREEISKNTMKEFFKEYYEKNIRTGNYLPNAETIRALEESKRGIGVQKYSSVEDMFSEIYQELEEEGFKVERHVSH
jgi:uncharacterized phage-associated protein